MSMEIRPLSEVMGAEIVGIDLAKPIGDEDFARIQDAWHKHLVLIFRDQHLTEEQHIATGRRFGKLNVHMNTAGLHPNHPEIYVLSNIFEKGKPVGKGSTPYWHTDGSYIAVPPKASMLYGIETPEVGGDTLFANMYAAYDGLTDNVKSVLRGKLGVHNISDFGMRYAKLSNDPDAVKLASTNKVRTPDVAHPIAVRHPETGRTSLFVNEGFTIRILDMPERESDELLTHLLAHYTKPEYTFVQKWRQFDLVLWDNRCTNHSATGGYKAPSRRLMHRVTIAADAPPLAA